VNRKPGVAGLNEMIRHWSRLAYDKYQKFTAGSVQCRHDTCFNIMLLYDAVSTTEFLKRWVAHSGTTVNGKFGSVWQEPVVTDVKVASWHLFRYGYQVSGWCSKKGPSEYMLDSSLLTLSSLVHNYSYYVHFLVNVDVCGE
jgi:hypothetical protein